MSGSDRDRNDELFDRARAVIPGGVNSPVRAYVSVGVTPRFMASARGPYITDAKGREYVDLVASWGPALLGHAHPEVVEAVRDAASRGLSFGAPTQGEVELAALIAERVVAGDPSTGSGTGAGVSLPPSVFEAWFLTAAHDEDALGQVLEALPGAAGAAASASAPV